MAPRGTHSFGTTALPWLVVLTPLPRLAACSGGLPYLLKPKVRTNKPSHHLLKPRREEVLAAGVLRPALSRVALVENRVEDVYGV